MTLFMLVLILGTTVWVAYDAKQRDWSGSSFASSAWIWVVGSLLLWIVVFPLYLFQRGRVPERA
jgi:hypothetical protein